MVPAEVNGQLNAQQLRSRVPQLVQRSGLRHAEQPQRRLRRAGLVLGLRRGQRPAGPPGRVGGQLRGPLTERGRGGQATAVPRPADGALEFDRDVLIHLGGRKRSMPSPAVGVDSGVGGLGEGLVDALPLPRRRFLVDRRPAEGMAEPHQTVELDEPGRGGRRCGLGRYAQPVRCPPQQHRVTHRLGRGDQKQLARRRRKRCQLPPEVVLDPGGQDDGAGQPEPAGELPRRHAERQLQQGPRVAARLGHDPIPHPLVQRTDDRRLQQRPGIALGQPADHEFRQSGESLPSAG